MGLGTTGLLYYQGDLFVHILQVIVCIRWCETFEMMRVRLEARNFEQLEHEHGLHSRNFVEKLAEDFWIQVDQVRDLIFLHLDWCLVVAN